MLNVTPVQPAEDFIVPYDPRTLLAKGPQGLGLAPFGPTIGVLLAVQSRRLLLELLGESVDQPRNRGELVHGARCEVFIRNHVATAIVRTYVNRGQPWDEV